MGMLDGKIALVTGAARGLGEAISKSFIEQGAEVLLTDMNEEQVAETARGLGNKASFLRHDVTSEDDWKAAIAAVKETFGGLDVLVNNAGIAGGGRLEETTLEEWRQITAVNMDGVFLGHKYAAPLIRERADKWEGGGSIINLSSVAGLIGLPGAHAYCASKGAVRLLTKSAALEYAGAGENIRVNSIHPAFIDTPMAAQMVQGIHDNGLAQNLDEARALLEMMHPIGRLGEPKDIASAATFLASDESSFMTGSEFVVDGGLAAG